MTSILPKFRLIKREDIRPDPDQPREIFNEEDMEGLRASIERLGILQPLRVRYEPSKYDGTPFIITDGERRWRASDGVIGELPCIEASDDPDEVSLASNIQRAPLLPEEEATALQKLAAREGLTLNALARRIGKSDGYVSNRLNLLKAGEDVQELARAAPQKMSAALLIDKVKEPALRRELIEEAATGASYKKIESHIAEAEERAALQRASQKAPDAETQERSNAFSRGDVPNVSRGQRVKGPSRSEVRAAVLRVETELITWSAKLSDEDYKELVEEFARRILRGDLKR